MSDKKQKQLGMNPSTANGRLLRDVLYSLVVKNDQNDCYRCGNEMSRETFSIEHITPWLDSDDPVSLYFDMNNISFSHIRCNIKDARRPNKIYEDKAEQRRVAESRRRGTREYCPIKRRNQYLTRGT